MADEQPFLVVYKPRKAHLHHLEVCVQYIKKSPHGFLRSAPETKHGQEDGQPAIRGDANTPTPTSLQLVLTLLGLGEG